MRDRYETHYDPTTDEYVIPLRVSGDLATGVVLLSSGTANVFQRVAPVVVDGLQHRPDGSFTLRCR